CTVRYLRATFRLRGASRPTRTAGFPHTSMSFSASPPQTPGPCARPRDPPRSLSGPSRPGPTRPGPATTAPFSQRLPTTLSAPRDSMAGARRVARTAVAAGLAAARSAAGPVPMALAADAPPAAPVDGDVKSAPDKLGSKDADLLAEAKAEGAKHVTMMIAT